ncbi:FecCD family ABC transporter permease [Leucobacter musarum]|uniref:FecCD family ABC transporter permease n=1 Tax=Leucobacter musarum TaxID=1930747 RepID=UPI0006A7AA78|nr:iron ABC transporter permease [Leucobacter musarum]
MTGVMTRATASPERTVRDELRAAHARARRRIVVVCVSLSVVTAALFIAALMAGSQVLSPGEAVGGITGTGTPSTVFVVRELRLPRALTAALVGLALGAAGTLFQRVLGNPLASPDFLGVSAGAGTLTAGALVLGGASGLALPGFALLGGFGTAALIYAVAWRRGVSEYRFILVGIGVATFAGSITSYLIARAEFSDARAALTWLTGSVGMATPELIALLAGTLVLFVPVGWAIARLLRRLELGEETARMLGARVERDRFVILGAAVVLVSIATAAVGPIAFIAMLAGPIAQVLLGTAGRSILAAALTGAVLMQSADLIAQHALPWPISTGVVTGVFGAPYIAAMLIRTARKAQIR